MPKYVLWDIDGTLLKNARFGGGLYDEAVKQVTGFTPLGPRPAEHGKVDGQIIAERLAEYGLDPAFQDAVAARLDELALERHIDGGDRRELVPGAREALAAVAAAGWTNAILTGNSTTRARAKFLGAGLDPDLFDWEHSFFGGQARQRTDVTAAAAAALGDDPHVIVGDTPTDDLAAKAAGIPFVAVATGVFSVERLRQTGAVLVLPDLVHGLEDLLGELRNMAVLAR
ncbi:HAD family hydrolase [Naasia sp. SYSU D00948]|uniref:HAD family hydrolase n=1 Tax=Naasia sp. SYSU D00948 TaxID=2817379 RepID=UPI001B30100F|nr:HAD family hydrolase [Naasia sp. SYSU D00948]